MRLLFIDKSGLLRRSLRQARRKTKHAFRMYLAARARRRSVSKFIGVTGSSGKSTATALLAHILSAHAKVEAQFLFNVMSTLNRFLSQKSKGADCVIVEVGASGLNSVGPMAELLLPDVAVVTMARLEHYSAFRKIEAVSQEKGSLVEAVQPGGLAVLNADDENVMSMKTRTKERVVTFGLSPDADYQVSTPYAAYPEALSFTMRWGDDELELKTCFPGVHFWVPVAAAVATALELGVPPQIVAERTASFEPLANRGEVIAVAGGPRFMVDTAKSPWHSLGLAFDMLGAAEAKRKRLVLGHISDYAGSTRKYGTAFRQARELCDQVIFVGENSHRSRASDEDREAGRFREITAVKDVADYLRETAVEDELILLKGSGNLHLERIAIDYTHGVKCWIDKCGKPFDCRACGYFDLPFEQHGSLSKREKKLRNARLRNQGRVGSASG